MNTLFEKLGKADFWRAVDVSLSESLCRIAGENDPLVRLAVATVSRFAGSGHVCVDLGRIAGTAVHDDDGQELEGLEWPDLKTWSRAVEGSKLVQKEETHGAAPTPLVLEGGRLYLRRYHEYEKSIANKLGRWVAREDALPPGFHLDGVLSRLFKAGKGKKPDHGASGADRQLVFGFARTCADPRNEAHPAHGQLRAVATAALRPLTIISGGPGTGKTHTVLRILCGLVERAFAAENGPPRIYLAAPTGKAAARLSESIIKAKRGFEGVSARVLQAVPDQASTVHRLLEPRGRVGMAFRHGSDEPLGVDVLVVDEVSMVDASLMAKLLDAVPDAARLILVGDEDQLASVEAGSVFADICQASRVCAPSSVFARQLEARARVRSDGESPRMSIADSYVRLTHSFRFSSEGGIGRLAARIRAGDADGVMEALRDCGDEVEWVETHKPAAVSAFVLRKLEPHFESVFAASDPAERLELLGRLQLLCAHRQGPGGAQDFNRLFEARLGGRRSWAHGGFYDARPLLVVRNAPGMGLYNGDVGVLCGMRDAQRAFVAFSAEGTGRVREISPSRLPEHESVYAMTVHKSQGSEYEEVLLVLPPRPSPVMTRELLYTAVTRARKKIVVVGAREVVRHAVESRTKRWSGLTEMLTSKKKYEKLK